MAKLPSFCDYVMSIPIVVLRLPLSHPYHSILPLLHHTFINHSPLPTPADQSSCSVCEPFLSQSFPSSASLARMPTQRPALVPVPTRTTLQSSGVQMAPTSAFLLVRRFGIKCYRHTGCADITTRWRNCCPHGSSSGWSLVSWLKRLRIPRQLAM